MAVFAWVMAGGVLTTAVATVAAIRRRRRRSRRPLTAQESLRAARQASARIRRDTRPAGRFDRPGAGGDRYSASILENSFYGDMADSGGSDGGGGSGGD